MLNNQIDRIKHLLVNLNLYLILFVIVAIFLSLKTTLFIGWNNEILGIHEFRQTQTAITAYYMSKGGKFFAYETPVLGVPWSIPLEFPLYQGIVSVIHSIFDLPLIQVGRAVSVFFYFSCALWLFFIFRLFIKHKALAASVSALFLLAPVHMFYSRTFMMESTVLFFSLGYIYFSIRAIQQRHLKHFLVACFMGIIAALMKITTFFPYALVVSLFILCNQLQKSKWNSVRLIKDNFKLYFLDFVFLIIPQLLIFSLWTTFADKQKLLVPFAANFLTSKALVTWNFGTWQQKIDATTWKVLLEYRLAGIIGSSSLLWLFLGISISQKRKYLLHVFILMFSCAATFMVFTNVYKVHDYYVYGNGTLLIATIGFILASLYESEDKWQHLFATMLIFFIGKTMWDAGKDYRAHAAFNPTWAKDIGDFVKTRTAENDIVLIWGHDWSAELPFYLERRSVMDRNNRSLNDPEWQATVKNLEITRSKVAAEIFCGKMDISFIQERLRIFGLSNKLSASMYNCQIYLDAESST